MRYLNTEWVKAEYESGRSIASIAEETGQRCDSIRGELVGAGVELREASAVERFRGGAWASLREKAEAARVQLAIGPKEWPGRPSAQRLALFLEASPDNVLALLDDLAELAEACDGR